MCDHHSFFTKTQEPYTFLLERREWGAKRTRILARDQYTCRCYGRRESDGTALQVHHSHYIYGRDPWEYKDSELITLCEDCHQYVHAHSVVPVYRLDGDNLVEVHLTPCRRCAGAGWFPEFKHIQNGICFRCHGARYEELIDIVEEYALEHDIDIEDIDDGFKVLDPKSEKIEEARVRKGRNEGSLYAELLFDDGIYRAYCLDYSVDVNPGDLLDLNKLRYRIAVKKNGEEYVIIKGKKLITPAV